MSYNSQFPQLNDEAWLREQYQSRSAVEIAEAVGCGREAVARALKRFSIKRVRRGPMRISFPQLQDKKWLKREIRDKPLRQIADELGCTAPAVNGALKRHGIPIPKRTKHRQTDKSKAVKRGLSERYPDGRTGSKSPRWKGGRTKRGPYWWLHRELVEERWPIHPRLALPGWSHKQEHILVMEAHLGRCLTQSERVHHKNHNKEDNRLENLVRKGSQGEHARDHAAEGRLAAKYRQMLIDAGIATEEELDK